MGGAPAIRLNGKYRPLVDSANGDDDFDLVTATPIVNGRPGIPPDGTIGYLVNTTRHGNPETLALHSGPGGGPGGADLIAHHEGNSPPIYSSMVGDITGDSINPLRTAGLHTIFRVRSMVDGFCKGKTASSNAGLNSVYLNGTRSAGDHTGWLPTTYATHDALHSHEVGGNQRPATKHHELGITPEGRMLVSGANDCDTLWTRGDPKHDSPLEILDQYEPDEISLGLFPHRTWCMTDEDGEHNAHCGKKEQLRRWHTPLPITLKPSCFKSRETVATDANGNPGRSFGPGPEVYAPTAYEGTGFRFISRPNILAGAPSVPYNPRDDQ